MDVVFSLLFYRVFIDAFYIIINIIIIIIIDV